MLTISEVAGKFNISNRQVQDLMNYGYLNVAQVNREENRGITFLFSEKDIEQLDIPSLMEEIKEKKKRNQPAKYSNSADIKRIVKALNYYDRFLEDIYNYSEAELLLSSFYLFHLNHYAKTYREENQKLYKLKSQVLQKMYTENQGNFEARYLLGPDRKKIWLCEDCKEAAHSAGSTYNRYIRNEYYCPKCYIQSVEKEYYSLVEFILKAGDYRFVFHTPRGLACAWMKNIHELPQDNRRMGSDDDRMYLYGRRISAVEERVFPLAMIIEKLSDYLKQEKSGETVIDSQADRLYRN